jgi:hypothetical protein
MLGSDPSQYTFPVYGAALSTLKVPVYIASTWSDVRSPTAISKGSGVELQIPVPAVVQSANGSDSQVVVWDRQTGDEWGFWEFFNSAEAITATAPAQAGTLSRPLAVRNAYADFWVGQQIVIGRGAADAERAVIASFPDASHMILRSPTKRTHLANETVWGIGAANGYHYNTQWSGVPPTGFGSRGAGVPYLAGLVRPCEIGQRHIDHALAFAYQNTTSGFVYPATKSDGTASNGMPEGSRLQLNPAIPGSMIKSWGCLGACFTIAKALQRYGMYLIDTAGHPKVFLEYDGTAHWGNGVSAATTNPIPLAAFRVIDR